MDCTSTHIMLLYDTSDLLSVAIESTFNTDNSENCTKENFIIKANFVNGGAEFTNIRPSFYIHVNVICLCLFRGVSTDSRITITVTRRRIQIENGN